MRGMGLLGLEIEVYVLVPCPLFDIFSSNALPCLTKVAVLRMISMTTGGTIISLFSSSSSASAIMLQMSKADA